uniref:Uncharacterized protein n=1 Tax=Homalodisca liturata TaxID=320908 RepID=A0A1B6JH48_9HEMI
MTTFRLCLLFLCQFCIGSDLSFHVRYLDKKICESIENPVLLGGKYLYRDLLDLVIFLQEIEHKMKDGNRDGDRETMSIIEEGGLHLPNITQNDERLMEAFNWTQDQVDELRMKTQDIAGRWHNMLHILKRQPLYPVDYDIDSDKFLQNPRVNTT